jgi:cell wall-associated NlpC family hydrolase
VKKVALLLAVPLVAFVMALLGLVVLFSTVGGTAQAAACTLSTLSTSKASSAANTTTTTPSSNANCGAAATATLPTSPVVNEGLSANYVIPAGATAAESVAITYALAQLGKPYLWGGTGPAAFDCSGLINEGTAVTSYARIAPGDLVLVPGSDGTVANPGHVGIYLGDGLVESAVDVQYGVIVQPYSYFISGGLSGIRHVG